MNVDLIRDEILRKLDSLDNQFGTSFFDLPQDLGQSSKDVVACLTVLEELGYIETLAEGKVSITPKGTFFINSDSFCQITERQNAQDLYERNKDNKTHKINISNLIIAIIGILISASIVLYGNNESTEYTTIEIARATAKVDSLAKEIDRLKNVRQIVKPMQYDNKKQTKLPVRSIIK